MITENFSDDAVSFGEKGNEKHARTSSKLSRTKYYYYMHKYHRLSLLLEVLSFDNSSGKQKVTLNGFQVTNT